MMSKIFSGLAPISFFALLVVQVNGQQQDTLSGIRMFMKVCNAYKQLPLQLELKMRNSTNLITGQEDTMSFQARFCLQQGGSYIGFGELEQIVDDSLMLLVSNKLKRMVVYANHQSMANQLKQYLGLQFKDSSLIKMAGKYAALLVPVKKDTAAIEVKSRSVLYITGLPKETIQVKYNANTCQPFEVVQLRRSLISIGKADYSRFTGRPEFEGKLLAEKDSSFFVIKEQVSTFLYGDISHDSDLKLPARIGDRIVADISGKYQPVKAYADFLLTQEF